MYPKSWVQTYVCLILSIKNPKRWKTGLTRDVKDYSAFIHHVVFPAPRSPALLHDRTARNSPFARVTFMAKAIQVHVQEQHRKNN